MRRCATTVVLDDAGERLLLMRRHRFIVDSWVWELPLGYVDETAEVPWVPLEETPEMIARGDILGAITIIGVQHARLQRAT
jgi:8-oxo-dGTP pyrophosphatase MutT (NUDIX family)